MRYDSGINCDMQTMFVVEIEYDILQNTYTKTRHILASSIR